jgi:hypothetical protein
VDQACQESPASGLCLPGLIRRQVEMLPFRRLAIDSTRQEALQSSGVDTRFGKLPRSARGRSKAFDRVSLSLKRGTDDREGRRLAGPGVALDALHAIR